MTGWTIVSLGEVAEKVDYGVTASASKNPVGYKFLRITDIQNNTVDWDSVPWCECDERTASRSLLRPGDIVFARTGATTGKSFLVRDCPENTVFASYLIRVRLRESVEPEYLINFFNSPKYWSQVAKGARGAAQLGVNATTLQTLKIPLPELFRQREIAGVLGQAREVRLKRQTSISELEGLVQSEFFHMFGDPVENQNKFPVVPLLEIVNKLRPISYGILMPGPDQDVGVKYVRVVDMKRGGIDVRAVRKTTSEISESYRRSLLCEDDILMSIRGHVGRLASVPSELEGANITQDTARIAVDSSKALPVFVRECLRAEGIQRWMAKHVKGVAVKGINLADVKKIPIMLPSLKVQEEFSLKVQRVEDLIASFRIQLEELDSLVLVLQHRAFRGEL